MSTDPISLIVILFILSLLPVFFVLTTSFVKISMVCLLTRDSIGVQQIPPNIVIYGLSLVLSFYVMGPVYNNSYLQLTKDLANPTKINGVDVISHFEQTSYPIKKFLITHSNVNERNFFRQSLNKLWSKDMLVTVKDDDFILLVPAFVVSELTQGFKIGFLLYLPSVIIDIIVSNILLAMGMMMMSPVTISLPIKLLLFVALDGWSRLLHALLGSY